MVASVTTERKTMSPQLLVRPGNNDHEVIEELLAPDSSSLLLPGDTRGPIDRVIADAHIAQKRPQLAVAAESVGVPFLVDPLTHFWQTDLRESDKLAALPYGSSVARVGDDFLNPLKRESLIASVIEFQLERGATQLIPPYLYARRPEDEWFARTLELLEATRRRLDRIGVQLPVLAVLEVGHQAFAPPSTWSKGIDLFARKAAAIGAEAIAVGLSPVTPKDGYAKVLATFEATARAKQVSGLRTYAWRDGIFGAGLCAAGIDGYEAGIATSEACNLSSSLASRKPRAEKRKSGGNAPGIFVDMLGRSVPAAVGRALLASSVRDRVMCDDERCCPDGPASTIARPRQHAVRMRARQLRLQEGLPHSSWRLHQLSKDCIAGSTLVLQANQILKAAEMKERLPSEGLNAMGKVARHLLSDSAADAA
jgi:hypothetical protein